jgi:hypothetical protein
MKKKPANQAILEKVKELPMLSVKLSLRTFFRLALGGLALHRTARRKTLIAQHRRVLTSGASASCFSTS